MNRFVTRRLISVLSMAGLVLVSPLAFASAFQLWEQDGASVGNYHAGYAAIANDASTAFYNPAGIIRFKNQQLVLSTDGVITDFKYEGTVGVNTILAGIPRPVTAQGGNFGFVPAIHYVAPISDAVGFGFSVDVPFGLKTTYGRETIIRYAATTTAATVVDVSPSLGIAFTDKASFGFGFDAQRMEAEFDQVGGMGFPTVDAEGINKKVTGMGYGYHLGALYQMSEASRMGLSYHSQVVHHLNGISLFVGPLATAFAGGPLWGQGYVNITLPPYTAFSVYHHVTPAIALMGSAIYTQWNISRTLAMHNVAGLADLSPSTNITITVPQYYRNTWNFSVGADVEATDKIIVRGGVGYDQTPVQSGFRNISLPDGNRFAIATGGHFQATKTMGFDLGWTHLFMRQLNINPPPLASGDQVVTTNGNVNGGADVIAAQMTWDIV